MKRNVQSKKKIFKKGLLTLIFPIMICLTGCSGGGSSDSTPGVDPLAGAYAIVDTGQTACYNNSTEIPCPDPGEAFYGQDAQYQDAQPQYTDNGDGTITDNVTGLMWQKGFTQVKWADAASDASAATTGGYTDWRVPTIKELYSLILFTGNQGSGDVSSSVAPADAIPFIDTDYFDFEYPAQGRYIDAQYISCTQYVSTVMNGVDAFFGVNFADGRIKAYPKSGNISNPEFYVRDVRGRTNYGVNEFVDNGDGTVTDKSTGLMWCKVDSGYPGFADSLSGYTHSDGSLNWEEALDFCENLDFAGYSDWRLPNAKELQSIVDYTRAPDTTGTPAIDPVLYTTAIINEAIQMDFPFFWTSTTFLPGPDAVYIAFGRALGYTDLGDGFHFYDVHGAGAQRTDTKIGNPSYGFGLQGDVRRVYNFVRPVRDAG